MYCFVSDLQWESHFITMTEIRRSAMERQRGFNGRPLLEHAMQSRDPRIRG